MTLRLRNLCAILIASFWATHVVGNPAPMPAASQAVSKRSAEITAAIVALNATPSDANRRALYETLRGAQLYIAVMNPPADWTPDRTVKLEQAMTLQMLTASASNGAKALLAFSDLAQLRRNNANTAYAVLETKAVLALVVSNRFDALLLNRAGPWAAIPREDAEKLLSDELQKR